MALNYVIKHFYRFASEIAYAFRSIFYLEKENWKDTINVVSLGCGPCSELYGIVDELERQGSDLKVNYRGAKNGAKPPTKNGDTRSLFYHPVLVGGKDTIFSVLNCHN